MRGSRTGTTQSQNDARRAALVLGAAALGAPLAARAQDAGGDSGSTLVMVIAVAVVAVGLVVTFLPRIRPLRGRLVVRDAFGPSAFASSSLAAIRGWSGRADIDPVPSREGLLCGVDVKRGLGPAVEVTLRFDKGGQTREVVAGRIGPGERERVGDLVIDYDDGRGPDPAVV